jgi:hypothetical protein
MPLFTDGKNKKAGLPLKASRLFYYVPFALNYWLRAFKPTGFQVWLAFQPLSSNNCRAFYPLSPYV